MGTQPGVGVENAFIQNAKLPLTSNAEVCAREIAIFCNIGCHQRKRQFIANLKQFYLYGSHLQQSHVGRYYLYRRINQRMIILV